MNLKYLLQHVMIDLNYQMNHVPYHIPNIINRVMFRNKTGYCLELSTPEKMKLLGGTGNKITKDTNGENEPNLGIPDVLLVH